MIPPYAGIDPVTVWYYILEIVGRFADLFVGGPKLVYHADLKDTSPTKVNHFAWTPIASGSSEPTTPGINAQFTDNPGLGTDVSFQRPTTTTVTTSAGKFVTDVTFEKLRCYLLEATFTNVFGMINPGSTRALVLGIREGGVNENDLQKACRLTMQVRQDVGSTPKARLNAPLSPILANRSFDDRYNAVLDPNSPKEVKLYLYFEPDSGFARGSIMIDNKLMDQHDFGFNDGLKGVTITATGMAIACATADGVTTKARFVDFKVYADSYKIRKRAQSLLDVVRRGLVRAAFRFPRPSPFIRG